jgi:hypothetical protein
MCLGAAKSTIEIESQNGRERDDDRDEPEQQHVADIMPGDALASVDFVEDRPFRFSPCFAAPFESLSLFAGRGWRFNGGVMGHDEFLSPSDKRKYQRSDRASRSAGREEVRPARRA